MVIHTLELSLSYHRYFSAIYDTSVFPYPYTGSENIDIPNHEISLTFPLKVNGEIVLNPRLNNYFESYAGTSGFTLLQNIVDGSQPMAIFNSLDESVEFFGDLDIPNLYHKSEIDAIGDELSALVLNTYTEIEVGALMPNIHLVGYYTKTEVDTQLTDYTTISHLQGNYMTALAITETLMNNYATITLLVGSFYSKAEIDSTLSDYITATQIYASHYTKSEIGTTLLLCSPPAQILNIFYSKLYIDSMFLSSAQAGTLYYNKAETGNMLISYSTGSYVDYTFYNKAETGNLLADKVSNIGDISLPGWLGICTLGYTNSRIRCNAEVGGYTGYAELRAYSSYDMFLNLSTARIDGGWMYFRIGNDSCMQLSGSDSKVNVFKDMSISGNLDVDKVLTLKRIAGVSATSPLVIINDRPGGGTGVVYQSTASGQGFSIAYITAQSSVAWVEGVNWGGSNEFIIKSGSNGLTLKPTGDAVLSGNLDVGGVMDTTKIDLTNGDQNSYPLVITNTGGNWFQGEYTATANQVGCLYRYKTSGSSTYWWSGVWGSNTNDF